MTSKNFMELAKAFFTLQLNCELPPHLRCLPLPLPLLHLHCHPLHHPEGQPRRKFSHSAIPVAKLHANQPMLCQQKTETLWIEFMRGKKHWQKLDLFYGLSTPDKNFKVHQKLECPPIDPLLLVRIMIFLAEVSLLIFTLTGKGDIPKLQSPIEILKLWYS